MKKVLIASIAALSLAVVSARATTVAQWTFETSIPTTAGPISPEVGSGTATGGTGGTYSSPAGDGSPHSYSSTAWDVGDYYQFQVNLTGLNTTVLDWDQTSSNTGPGQFGLQYSTDGSTFTPFGSTMTVIANATPNVWGATAAYVSAAHFTVNLSSLDGTIGNQATVYFRLVDASTVSANGGTTSAGGTDRVDNFTVSATAVPEPSTVALVGAGLVGLLAMRRRRS